MAAVPHPVVEKYRSFGAIRPEKGVLAWEKKVSEALEVLTTPERRKGYESSIPAVKDAIGIVMLIEPREHRSTEFTLRNWMDALAKRGWGLVIVHGTTNGKFMRSVTKGWKNVVYINSGYEDLGGGLYNKLLTDPKFWRVVPHENMLLVQTDTMCLDRGAAARDLLEFDYVGAPWWQTCPVSGHCFGSRTRYEPSFLTDGKAMHELWPEMIGNGGLSFRKRSFMLKATRTFRLAQFPRDDADHKADVRGKGSSVASEVKDKGKGSSVASEVKDKGLSTTYKADNKSKGLSTTYKADDKSKGSGTAYEVKDKGESTIPAQAQPAGDDRSGVTPSRESPKDHHERDAVHHEGTGLDLKASATSRESSADEAPSACTDVEAMTVKDGDTRYAIRNEDVFFAVAAKRLGAAIPSRANATKFFAEEVLPPFTDSSKPLCMGLHKIYAYQPASVVEIAVNTMVMR